MALAFAREGAGRVASRSSAKAARRSASGTRRSTSAPRAGCRRSSASRTTRRRCRRRSREQSAVRVFADKAAGYGIPGITIDGTDPDAIAAAFAWAAERARAGTGPRSSSSSAMRMCGHAHHDDMLYLGKDPQPSWELSAAHRAGLRRTASSTSSGRRAIRIPTYAARLEADGIIERAATSSASSARPRRSSRREARAVIDAPWPEPDAGGRRRVRRRAAARPRRGARSGGAGCVDARSGAAGRSSRVRRSTEGADVPRSGDARRRRRAARRSARVRLRRGRRRQVRQRVPAAAAAAEGVRRSHHQLAARRGRGARRLRRRGARGPAADRRDAVQRLRRDRLQPARQQRGEDPLPLGRHRCRWSCGCRGAGCATPARTTARTPSRGSTARRA